MNPSDLVYIYCDYLTSKSPVVEEETHSWSSLVRHFEQRLPFSKGNEIPMTPVFQRCLEKNRPLFETGEFILEGRARIGELVKEIQKPKLPKPELLNVSFSFDDRGLSTPEFQIYIEDEISQKDSSQNGILADLLSRDAQYASEWSEFLAAVRTQHDNSISLISLKKE